MSIRPSASTYVCGISWPRSGHHLLVRLLQGYFDDAFGYCEFHRPQDCCKVFPCARRGQINFSKNHDFGQETPQLPDQTYLIQHRAFIPSVVSGYELSPDRDGDDNAATFRTYAAKRWGPYAMFRDKWITSDFGTKRAVLLYEDLTSDPVTAMQPVVALFAPDHPYDSDLMARVAASVAGISKYKGANAFSDDTGVKNRRRVEDFRWYDPDTFAKLDRLVLQRRQIIHRWRKAGHEGEPDPDTVLDLMTLPNLRAVDEALPS